MAACHSIERASTATTHAQFSPDVLPTWRPVIYFADGRVKRLEGGLSHDTAMTIAERECKVLPEANDFGAQREGVPYLPRRSLTEQELIWGVTMDPSDKIIRLPGVMEKVGLKKSAIYKMIALGDFPKQVKLGARASGWLESEIKAWVDEQARQRS